MKFHKKSILHQLENECIYLKIIHLEHAALKENGLPQWCPAGNTWEAALTFQSSELLPMVQT